MPATKSITAEKKTGKTIFPTRTVRYGKDMTWAIDNMTQQQSYHTIV